jgi:hypothetical protein
MALRRLLLFSGVIASCLYVAADFAAAILEPEYHSFTQRMVSELMASGSPTERLVDPIFFMHGVFVLAFGVGVWLAVEGKPASRLTAAFLIALGIVDLPGPIVFEMGVRGTRPVGADAPHMVFTALIVLLILLAMGASAFTRGRTFRIYTFASIAGMCVLGVVTSVQAEALVAGAAETWIGVTERAMIGLYLAWQAALSLLLLRRPEHGVSAAPDAGAALRAT